MTDLKSRFEDLKKERGRLLTREGAKALGVSEAALVNAMTSDTTVRLRDDFKSIMEHIKVFGCIMGLVRNDNFVAMPIGEFNELSFDGTHGHAKGGNIDLTFDLEHWASAFAIKEISHDTLRRMVQIFDDCGEAVFKAVLWSSGSDEAFDSFMNEFKVSASTPLNDTQSGDSGWQKFTFAENAQIITDNTPMRTQEFLQACIDMRMEIELQIPTNASLETYRGPLRKLEVRGTPGWIDLRYPHFTTHFGVGEINKVAVLQENGICGAASFIDGSDNIICRVRCAKPHATSAQDDWNAAVASALLNP